MDSADNSRTIVYGKNIYKYTYISEEKYSQIHISEVGKECRLLQMPSRSREKQARWHSCPPRHWHFVTRAH